MQCNSKPVYMIDKRILVREGWKYIKYEFQVPILVAEVGRGWQTIIIKCEQHIYHRRGRRGSQKINFMSVFNKLNRLMKTYYSIREYQSTSFIKHFDGNIKVMNKYIFFLLSK